EILVGDHERTGHLLPEDLARLASKRDLTADEIDEIANRLHQRGIEFAEEEIPADFAAEDVPDKFDASSWSEVGVKIPNLPLLTPKEEKKLAHACRPAEKLLATASEPLSPSIGASILA